MATITRSQSASPPAGSSPRTIWTLNAVPATTSRDGAVARRFQRGPVEVYDIACIAGA
jgi:hypothetical protein